MTAAGLAERRLEPEAMDAPGLDPRLHREALKKLAQFNFMARCAGMLAPEIARVQPTHGGPLRVLDLATGAGDVPCQLTKWAEHRGIPWRIDGVDISEVAVSHARDRAARLPAAVRPTFTVLDVLNDPLPLGYDVVTSSLFLHHLSDTDAVRLLAKMRAAATRGVIVQDLLRSRAAMRLTWLVTRLCSRNPLILTDGLLSVAAAFTLEEVASLARRAGLVPVRLERRWPCRFLCSSMH